jgi:putative phosphoesterase
MSKIAIFSDVHGNLPALKTVLNDIDLKKADQVYCLGDLVDFAPWSNEVVELVRSLKITCLMGNHDERIAFDHEVIPLAKHGNTETLARISAIRHTKNTISPANKAYLAGLPGQLKLIFHINGKDLNIHLVHASVNSNDEYIYEDHDLKELSGHLERHQTDILVMGHTHQSYIRKLPFQNKDFEQLVINCGSVGRTKEDKPLATYLLLNVEQDAVTAEIIKLAYPIEETIAAIRESDIPDYYADFLRQK